MRVLFPGTTLVIAGREVRVFPLGVRHVGSVTKAAEEIIPRLLSSGFDARSLATKEGRSAAWPSLLPMIVGDMMKVINECVEGVDLEGDDLPHWYLPPIVDAWVEESFGDAGKVKPWVDMLEATIRRVTRQELGLWETLSKHASPQDTTPGASSTLDSQG